MSWFWKKTDIFRIFLHLVDEFYSQFEDLKVWVGVLFFFFKRSLFLFEEDFKNISRCSFKFLKQFEWHFCIYPKLKQDVDENDESQWCTKKLTGGKSWQIFSLIKIGEKLKNVIILQDREREQ